MKPIVNYTIPLGLRCPAADMLKRLGTRKCSYPFDWTLLTKLDGVVTSLQDDFSEFLDRSKYVDNETTKRNQGSCGHSTLPGGNNMFVHRDPRIDEDYQYTSRCVDRMREVLTKSHSKLFVVGGYFHGYYPNFQNDVKNLNQVLSSLTKNYYILVLEHERVDHSTPNTRGIKIDTLRDDNIFFGNLFTRSGMNKKWLRLANKADARDELNYVRSLFDFSIIDDIGK
jgi:hypothetical protein